jgi:hypothetical protein
MLAKIDVTPEIILAPDCKVNRRLLWLGLFAGPLGYGFYVASGYLLLQSACRVKLLAINVGGLSLCAVLLLILTLLSSLLTLLTGLTNFRRLRRQVAANRTTSTPTLSPLIYGSVLITIFFTGVILLTGIPLFVLLSCNWL